MQKDNYTNGWHRPDQDAVLTTNDDDYQEVPEVEFSGSSSSAALLEPKVPKCAPKIHIERKQFNDQYDPMALSTASSATSNSREPFEPLLNYHSEMSTKSVDSNLQTPVQLTPKEPPSPLTPFLPCPPPNSPGPDANHPASAATLPRCKKDTQRFFATDNSNSQNDAAPVGCDAVMTVDRKYKTQTRPKPPAPPARRVPSWVGFDFVMMSLRLFTVSMYRCRS